MAQTNRKSLEIGFRRWVQGIAPSRKIVPWLRVQDRSAYVAKLGEQGQIDHVVPLSLFNLSDPTQIRLAWSLDNVRRLPAKENKDRGACVASAYLSLLASEPIDRTEYDALIAMVWPTFAAQFPRITITIKDRLN